MFQPLSVYIELICHMQLPFDKSIIKESYDCVAQDVLLVTLVHLRLLKMSGICCILFLLVIIKKKGKMTMLVIRDLGITYYFQKIYILRVNNESSACPSNILF